MNIHEYQAKEILKKKGIPVAAGKIAFTPEQAVACYRDISSGRCVVKAQVHSGARGKAGGIILCNSAEKVKKAASKLLDSRLVTQQTGPQGLLVNKVYVEEAGEIGREFYLAFVVDRSTERVVVVASREGGTEIEELASTRPDSIIRLPIDPAIGMQSFHARAIAFALGIKGNLLKPTIKTLLGCYDILVSYDAHLVEINPFAEIRGSRLIALDAKINFDDNALFKNTEVNEMRDKSQEDARETKASDQDLSYVGLDGNIGCMINGAGLAMATMDMIKHVGGNPANFLDIGGGASPDRVTRAFELVLADHNVKALLVNIYAGINRCDWIAEGIIQAFRTLDIKVPLVVRLSGTNVDVGRKMLKDSQLNIESADTLAEAATMAVQAVAAAGEVGHSRTPNQAE